MITAVLVVLLLIAFNALYVAAEYGTVAVRRTRIDQLASEGNVLARLLLPIVSNPRKLDVYISASQIGITASSLGLGAYGQDAIASSLAKNLTQSGVVAEVAAASVAVVGTLLALSALQVVLGELLPKALAMRYPSGTVLLTVAPMRWSLAIFSPFIRLLNGSANALLTLLRIPAEARKHVHLAEEIDMLVEESHEGGMLEDAERDRVHNVFRLATRKIREVMIPRTKVFAVDAETGLEELLEVATESAYTRIPVYRESLDDILGVIHVKDLLSATAVSNGPFQLDSVLREMPRVLETMPVNRLLSDMRARHVQMSVVVDEYGGTSGIITLEDLLEEVVGDIPDEYPKEREVQVEEMPDGRFRLPGNMLIDDINQDFGLSLDVPDTDTVGGLVMGVLGRMPHKGDRVQVDGCEVEVGSVTRYAVDWVLLKLLKVPDHSDD